MPRDQLSLVVIGGGIIGLATAWEFTKRHPGQPVLVLEKEPAIASHQTGRNSGVIHSGIYYKPGSLKAKNCRRGLRLIEQFADDHGLKRERCGKVIVAVNEDELARLGSLAERGATNGVTCRVIDKDELAEYEPACAGLGAIHVEDTGIIDYTEVCTKLVELVRQGGGDVVCELQVSGIAVSDTSVTLTVSDGRAWSTDFAVNCAGLHSDRVASLAGERSPVKIIPFRGEYYALKAEARHLCRNLIYPVPDPSFPFLGVHFTRMIRGDSNGHLVECGPNAVLAFAREGYTRTDVNWKDLAETLSYPAFWKLALKHWRTGAGELHRSFSKRAFVRALQRLVPDIQESDLETIPAGIRAQALAPNGQLLDDFSIQHAGRLINVCNAPSPAATASLAIAEHIVNELESSPLQH